METALYNLCLCRGFLAIYKVHAMYAIQPFPVCAQAAIELVTFAPVNALSSMCSSDRTHDPTPNDAGCATRGVGSPLPPTRIQETGRGPGAAGWPPLRSLRIDRPFSLCLYVALSALALFLVPRNATIGCLVYLVIIFDRSNIFIYIHTYICNYLPLCFSS